MNRLMSGDDVQAGGRDGAEGVGDPAAPDERPEREKVRDDSQGAALPRNIEDAQQRIESAREAARRRRRELGLPDLPADEVAPPKRGKRSAKRTKNHGQFMRQGSQ